MRERRRGAPRREKQRLVVCARVTRARSSELRACCVVRHVGRQCWQSVIAAGPRARRRSAEPAPSARAPHRAKENTPTLYCSLLYSRACSRSRRSRSFTLTALHCQAALRKRAVGVGLDNRNSIANDGTRTSLHTHARNTMAKLTYSSFVKKEAVGESELLAFNSRCGRWPAMGRPMSTSSKTWSSCGQNHGARSQSDSRARAEAQLVALPRPRAHSLPSPPPPPQPRAARKKTSFFS